MERKVGVKMLEQSTHQRPMGQFTKLFSKLRGGLYLHVNYFFSSVSFTEEREHRINTLKDSQ